MPWRLTIPPELYGPAGALAVLAFLVLALVRGDLVPGWVYRSELAQREKSDIQAAKTAEALTVLAKAAANGVAGGATHA